MVMSTSEQYDAVITECRAIYEKKLHDYGAAWRIMRPESITDQVLIKANRIRTLETGVRSRVGEGIRPELIGIINYCVMGVIQLRLGYASGDDMSAERALELYDEYVGVAKKLMMDKNHDYGEAWRQMRCESYTDLILMKLHRTKQIENLKGKTLISEGIDANYYDMVNYAVFYMIQMGEMQDKSCNK